MLFQGALVSDVRAFQPANRTLVGWVQLDHRPIVWTFRHPDDEPLVWLGKYKVASWQPAPFSTQNSWIGAAKCDRQSRHEQPRGHSSKCYGAASRLIEQALVQQFGELPIFQVVSGDETRASAASYSVRRIRRAFCRRWRLRPPGAALATMGAAVSLAHRSRTNE